MVNQISILEKLIGVIAGRSRKSSRKRRSRNTMVSRSPETLEHKILPATIVVTSLGDNLIDDGVVTLREAIQAADTDTSVSGSVAGSGTDTIEFAEGLVGTILLNGTQLETSSAITINGAGQSQLTIDAGAQSRAFHVLNSSAITISGLTIRNGLDTEGGAIRNDGTVTILDSTLTNNTATFDGGAIVNFGTAILNRVTVSSNDADGSGGGIYNWSALAVDNSSIYANTAYLDGGGIGAIGNISIANSTISINETTVGNGGGIQSDADFTIVGSTIIGNRASKSATGGGTGGGIAALANVSVELHNTVAAKNFSGLGSGLAASDISTAGGNGVDPISRHNFIGVDAGFVGITNGTNGNSIGSTASPLDPLLGPLNSFAGNFSHQPLAGSPLINAGDNSFANNSAASPATFDQTGTVGRIVDSAVDIGSVEANPHINVTFTGNRHIVDVLTTTGNDTIIIVPTSSRITVNQTNYLFQLHSLENPLFRIDGLAGSDQFRVELFDNLNDTAVLRPFSGEVSGPGYDISAVAVEAITINGHGGFDTVTFEDSAGDDVLVGRRDVGYLAGNGFLNTARNFEQLTATSTSGNDVAQLSSNNGLNRYSSTPSRVQFVNDLSYYDLLSFADTDTWLLGNTIDPSSHADFYDSVGNDTFHATPSFATLFGIGFNNTVHQTPVVRATSAAGGDDIAILYDSTGNDRFTVTPSFASLRPESGNAFNNNAFGFDSYVGYASTGSDTAEIHDSAGDDTLVSQNDNVVLQSSTYFAQASGFDVRVVYSLSGGRDRAQLFDSAGDNLLEVNGISASIEDSDGTPGSVPSWRTFAIGFEEVLAVGTAGGTNNLRWRGSLGFSFTRVGTWNFI